MTMTLNRRAMLAGFAASGALMMNDTALAARRRQAFFRRTGLPIGLQLYTLGDEAGQDLDRTFADVAAIGYRDIEMPQLFGKSGAEVGAAARRAGLAISSLHLPFAATARGAALTMESSPQQIADALGALGATCAVAPIMPFPAGMKFGPGESFQTTIARAVAAEGEDLWKRTAALLNACAGAMKPLGIEIGYHNHNLEFAPVGKTTGWDVLLAECDPALVKFEVDTGWVATAGLDPVAFLRRMRGRVRWMHVKDVAPGNAVNFALSMKPAEVGSGTLDWARVLPAAHRAGVRHFYVEQEPPFAIPRIEAARKSYGFLADLHA